MPCRLLPQLTRCGDCHIPRAVCMQGGGGAGCAQLACLALRFAGQPHGVPPITIVNVHGSFHWFSFRFCFPKCYKVLYGQARNPCKHGAFIIPQNCSSRILYAVWRCMALYGSVDFTGLSPRALFRAVWQNSPLLYIPLYPLRCRVQVAITPLARVLIVGAYLPAFQHLHAVNHLDRAPHRHIRPLADYVAPDQHLAWRAAQHIMRRVAPSSITAPIRPADLEAAACGRCCRWRAPWRALACACARLRSAGKQQQGGKGSGKQHRHKEG